MFVAATFYLYDLGECKKALNHQLILLLLLGKKPKTNPNFPSHKFTEITKKKDFVQVPIRSRKTFGWLDLGMK